MNLQVWFQPTRAMPTNPEGYYASTLGDSTGINHDFGPYQVYPDVFVCPVCVVTVPHVEVTCLTPEGYGGELEWFVEVLDGVSPPFR